MSSTMNSLTPGQGIGIGVAVGFVGALILAFIGVYATRSGRFSPKAIASKLKSSTLTLVSKLRTSTTPPELTTAPPAPPAPVFEPPPKMYPSNVRAFELDELRNIDVRMSPLMGRECLETVLQFSHTIAMHIAPAFLNSYLNVPASLFDEAQLVQLAGEPVNGGTWSESLSIGETRVATVMCFLSQLIFRRIHPSCNIEDSLLPFPIISAYRLMVDNASLNGNPLRCMTGVWREVTYGLMEIPFSLSRDPRDFSLLSRVPNDPRSPHIRSLVTLILNALRADELLAGKGAGYPEIMQKNLRSLLERSSNAAMELFCQPSEWEYSFVSEEPGFIFFPEVRMRWDDEQVRFTAPAKVVASDERPGDRLLLKCFYPPGRR